MSTDYDYTPLLNDIYTRMPEPDLIYASLTNIHNALLVLILALGFAVGLLVYMLISINLGRR